jgi:hypothetical protein
MINGLGCREDHGGLRYLDPFGKLRIDARLFTPQLDSW